LVYTHPTRRDIAMVFHGGQPFVSQWVVKEGAMEDTGGDARGLPNYEIQDEVTRAIEKSFPEFGYRAKWENGDFAISDNLALLHYAVPGTQASNTEKGTRILHRTTVAGEQIPKNKHGYVSCQISPDSTISPLR